MQDYGRNLKVGLFMVLGLAALGTLLLVYGELPAVVGEKTYEVALRFENAGGIEEGTFVFMQGIRIGSIARTVFVDPDHPESGVNAIALIEGAYNIPDTANAQIPTQQIGFSRPAISLIIPKTPSQRTVPRDGSGVIPGETIPGLSSLIPPELMTLLKRTLDQVGRLAERLDPVADDLHQLLQPRPVERVDAPEPGQAPVPGNLSSAAARLDQALKHINAVLGDEQNRSNLKAALDNFKAISEDGKVAAADLRAFASDAGEVAAKAKTIAGKAEATLDRTSDQLNDTFRMIIDDAGKLGRMLDHLDKAARDLAEGKGTAGLLLRDARLYEELTLTARRLSAAIENFDALLKQWKEQGVNLKGLGL